MQRTVSTTLAAALIAGLFAVVAPKPAQAGNIGFSIHYSSPGYYGDVYWDPEPRYYGRAHYYPRERYYRYRPRGYHYYRPGPPLYWSGYYAPRYYHGQRHHHRHYHRYPHDRWHRHHRHRW